MIPISKLKLNPTNPRIIKDDKFKKLVQSLKDFPEMMEKRPMVCVTDVDGKLFPIGGNMRLKALRELGMKEIPDSWVVLADDWTEEQRKEFTIRDNVGFGEWNWEELQENWDLDLISEWGVDFEWDEVEKSAEKEQIDLSDDLNVAFKIEIECENESEQEKLYNEFINRGLQCRLLTL
jgi:ParB-like chromosome segregation protein Spo0J